MTDDVFVPSFEDVAPEEPVSEEVGCASEPVETASLLRSRPSPLRLRRLPPTTRPSRRGSAIATRTPLQKSRSATRSPLCLPGSWGVASMLWMRGLLN